MLLARLPTYNCGLRRDERGDYIVTQIPMYKLISVLYQTPPDSTMASTDDLLYFNSLEKEILEWVETYILRTRPLPVSNYGLNTTDAPTVGAGPSGLMASDVGLYLLVSDPTKHTRVIRMLKGICLVTLPVAPCHGPMPLPLLPRPPNRSPAPIPTRSVSAAPS